MLANVLATTLLAALVTAGSGDAAATPAPAVAPPDTIQARVMILGVWHFAGGTNVVEPEVVDVLTPERQRQIEAVVDSLSRFEPTKVAVEVERADQARLDSLYTAYRADRHEIDASEQQQLGFRLAARNEAPVHAIDHKIAWPFGELLEYAKAHDPWFVDWSKRFRARSEAQIDSVHQGSTVAAALRWYNESDRYAELLYGPYMRMTEVGADSAYAGVEPVANLYRRNLRIFANLTCIVEPGDRILVIYGAGHAPFLREFVAGHPDMTLVDPLDYLGGENPADHSTSRAGGARPVAAARPIVRSSGSIGR